MFKVKVIIIFQVHIFLLLNYILQKYNEATLQIEPCKFYPHNSRLTI